MTPAAPSGAWLLLDRDGQSSVALPVPRQACLGLTRAVLFHGDSWRAGVGSPDVGWLAAWDRAGADPAVAVWLASRQVRALPERLAVSHLAQSLVLSDDFRSGRASSSRFFTEAAWESFVSQVAGPSRITTESWRRDGARRQEFARELLERVIGGGSDFVIGPVPAAASMEPSIESLVLRDAVRAASSLEACVGRFEAAVAETRLAGLRELAYGAGHEINNPLANIAARAQALLLEEQDSERRRRLSTIVDQAFRARDMIGGLMLFARPPKPHPRETDIGALSAIVIEAVESQANAKGVRLDYSPPPTSMAVWVDATQVGEAVRALVVNAVEAVEPGGRVALAVEGAIAETALVRHCVIHVSDDGHGMDEETAKRAFDPFFSGREAGRGIGLGLSKAWRFIDANGGAVAIESRRGRGTHVTVKLPLAEAITALGR